MNLISIPQEKREVHVNAMNANVNPIGQDHPVAMNVSIQLPHVSIQKAT